MFSWFAYDNGFKAVMPGNITLIVTPDRVKFGKAVRGTKWHAQVSIWDGKSTLSRYGRDEYTNLQDNVELAKRLAEDIYNRA